MTITPQQLQAWLTTKEDEHLEFKEAKQNFHFEKLVKYCCALANEGGGSIVLGVTDKRPRHVVGSQAFADLERTKAGLIERLHLRIDACEINHANGRVLVFTAPPRPIGMPIAVEGAYWMRAGEDLVPMTPDMLRRIFDESGPDYSAEICPKATLGDLDPAAIEDLRRRWHNKTQNAAILRASVDKQSPRNRRIAETLLRCGVVERSGQGADRMYEEMILHGKALPDYARSDRFDVFLILPGELRHPDLLRFLSRIEPEQVSQLHSHDLLVLRDAAIGQAIPAAEQARAAELAERGFLGRSRGGESILARKFARKAGTTIGQQRPRDAAYKKLHAFLEEHRQSGCTMEQLLEVTPELSRSSVKRVLDELREDGKAHTVGVTRNARWFPGAAP